MRACVRADSAVASLALQLVVSVAGSMDTTTMQRVRVKAQPELIPESHTHVGHAQPSVCAYLQAQPELFLDVPIANLDSASPPPPPPAAKSNVGATVDECVRARDRCAPLMSCALQVARTHGPVRAAAATVPRSRKAVSRTQAGLAWCSVSGSLGGCGFVGRVEAGQ